MSTYAEPLMICFDCRKPVTRYKLAERGIKGEWRLLTICHKCLPDVEG